MTRKTRPSLSSWLSGCLVVAVTVFVSTVGSAQQPIPELDPSLPPYNPEFPISHLVESFDLGDLGYMWREDLGVEGSERIWFKWFYQYSDAAQGDWVIRQMDNTIVATGSVLPTGPAPSDTLWFVDLHTLGSPTYPLRVQVQAIDAGGSAIFGGETNEVLLSEYVPGPTTCFSDYGLGELFTAKLEAIRSKFNVPALAGGIVTAGGGSQFDAVGYRKLAPPLTPVTSGDKWHIGSNTKAMTAMLVGLLQQQPGPLVQFSTTIGDVFPQSEFGTDPAHLNTTIEMLLAHRSGLPPGEDFPAAVWANLDNVYYSVTTRRRNFAVAMLQDVPPVTTPGDHFEYSNAGYILVGAMLEKIYGMSWEALLDQELLAPGKLDMSDTGFGAPPPLYNSDQPWGHAAEQGNELLIPNKGDNTPGLGPAGTVHTTLQDYAKFVRLLLNGSEGGVSLTTATRNELTKAYPGSTYGYGWGIFEETSGTDTRKILNHAGSNGSWFFVSEIRLDQGYAVIAVTNVANFWEPDLNTFNGLVPDEDGFVAHGAAATGEALTMLHEHFLGCPSWGISGGGWTTADGKIKESTLANQSDLIPVAAVPALSLWGGLALVASLSALGGLALSRVAGGRTPSSS